jgi:hypothetical protein
MTGQALDVFLCEHTLANGSLKAKPKSLKVKGDVSDDIQVGAATDDNQATDVALKTLDIFAGMACIVHSLSATSPVHGTHAAMPVILESFAILCSWPISSFLVVCLS